MENVVIFYDHLEYFTPIWYNFWPFGLVCGHLVYFLHFGMFGPRKIWRPWIKPRKRKIGGTKQIRKLPWRRGHRLRRR
jgi:hypothetical protein